MSEDWSHLWPITKKAPTNHGSFGAAPTAIIEARSALSREFDADADGFLLKYGVEKTLATRQALADFTGANVNDLVLVDNATEGFNTVVRSLPLGPGDEVLITDQGYANFPPPLNELAMRQGFNLVTAAIPYAADDDQIVDRIVRATNPQTRLAIIDHISSPTALIFPIEKIVAELEARGIACLVDGAHAPGQVPVDIDKIGASYYTANNHKWLCAPRVSGFLHVRRDRQDNIIPAVASGGGHRDVPFADRFGWPGTKDFTARFVVPETIKYMASLHPQKWSGIYARNHALAVEGRRIVADALGIEPIVSDNRFGSFTTLPLGPLEFDAETEKKAKAWRLATVMQNQNAGLTAYAMEFGGQYLLRLSAHLYNKREDYEILAEALPKIVEGLRPSGARRFSWPQP